jgi:hypothetical protein
VFDLPPNSLVSEVLTNASTLYAVWSTQAFSYFTKLQGKTPSQQSIAAATMKFSDGVWSKVEPAKIPKIIRKSASDSNPPSSDEPVSAPAAVTSSSSKISSKAPADALAPDNNQVAAASAKKRDRRQGPSSCSINPPMVQIHGRSLTSIFFVFCLL